MHIFITLKVAIEGIIEGGIAGILILLISECSEKLQSFRSIYNFSEISMKWDNTFIQIFVKKC